MVLSGFSPSTKSATMAIPDTRAIYKALFIYNFATLVDWPADYRKGDFNIGIYGDDNTVFSELSKKYSGLLELSYWYILTVVGSKLDEKLNLASFVI